LKSLASLELMTEEVQVWVASLDVKDGRYDSLARTLPAEERDRARNLTPPAARRFIIARGILRVLLAGFTGTAPEKLRFRYGTAGKPSLMDRDDIHFFEGDTAVLDAPARHDFQIADLGLGVRASVGFDEPDHDIDAFATECVRVFQHRIGFAHARCGADVDAKPCLSTGLKLRQQLLCTRPILLWHHLMLTRGIGTGCSPYELFTAFCRFL